MQGKKTQHDKSLPYLKRDWLARSSVAKQLLCFYKGGRWRSTKSGIVSPEAATGKLENVQAYKISGYKMSDSFRATETQGMHTAVNFKLCKEINEVSKVLNT